MGALVDACERSRREVKVLCCWVGEVREPEKEAEEACRRVGWGVKCWVSMVVLYG